MARSPATSAPRCASSPGTRVRLARRDHGATHGCDKDGGRGRARPTDSTGCASLQDRLWAEAKRSVLVVLQGIDAAGKDGTINKVMEAFNPQGCPVTAFKVPTHRGARPRLPVARPQAVPAARARSASSIARTTRTCSSSASTTSCRGRSGRKRYDQINDFERHADGERHDDRQVLPVDRPRRAARALPGPLRRPDQALEVLDGRPRGAQALGRLPGRLRRRAVEDARPTRRRGTSSRPTASGSATWRWRRSSPTRSPA